ncbi:MFS transporter [Limibaculum sp. M0105]|uniref:MFS transporter n=1 Tax=Thermohalobaculum xanthum TaxID=2753746 RepID=A0A8J7MBA6_9RHOB|nr:MFS transporter [Thermohalobaculum xanthum]MBK0401133.1 MFS transporter [Thermohalobaculum xanthum]
MTTGVEGIARHVAAFKGQIAPIAAISLFGLSMTMSYPLFALLLERAGASGAVIGLNTMAAAVSMVLIAPLMPRILRHVGIGPLMIGSALFMAAIFAAVPIHHGIAWWMMLRFAYGFAGTALFFASEFWIVGAAPEASRGRIIAIYGISLSASFMAGPLVLSLTGLEGWLPFLVAAGILVAGLAPIVWGLASAPPIEDEAPPRLADTLRFFTSDPAMIWAVVLFAAVEYGTLSLLSVWGVRSGLPEAEAVLLLAAFPLGAMLMQFPLGWAADRFDRRRLLMLIALVMIAAPLGMMLSARALGPLVPLMMVWGGLASGLYLVALTGLGARYTGQRLAQANAAVVLAYGVGALFSPPVLGAAMDAVDPDGLALASAVFALSFLVLVLARMLVRRKTP